MQLMSVCFVFILSGLCTADSFDGNDFDVTRRLGQLESYVKRQDERIKGLETTVSMQQRLLQMSGVSRGIRATDRPKHVAFSSYLDHKMKMVQIDQIIKFDKMVLNDGNGYNNNTGVFTVPVSGVYLFTYTVNTFVNAYQLVVQLVVDGVNYSDGVSDPFHAGQEAQGGNTVIMRLSKGQSVWLAAYNTANTSVDGREDYRFSTLSGVLMYE